MEDDIALYQTAFKKTFCKYLFQDSLRNLSSGPKFSRSNFRWEPKIVRTSVPVFVRDYDKKMFALTLQQLHDKGIIGDKDYNKYHDKFNTAVKNNNKDSTTMISMDAASLRVTTFRARNN